MTDHIPAWKRIGLQVKQDLENDPLSLTTHINSSTTTKQIKKIKQQKRKLQESNDKSDKKPPKRVKLPKSERNPPPEKDQLIYLNQFETDRDNWKFSKQKQNWILKHIKDIPAEYDSALKVYLDGLQGSSRNRIVEDFKNVCSSWNDKVKQIEDKIDQELKNPGILKKNEQDPQIEEDNVADYDYAVKCQDLIKLLTDEVFDLRGIIKQNEEEEEEEEEKEGENEKDEEIDVHEKDTKDVSKTIIPSDNLLIEEVNVDNFTSKSKKVVIVDGFADDDDENMVKKEKKQKKEKKSKKSNKSVKFT